MIMKKPTILRTLIFVLAMLFNFASYSQNLIAYNSNFTKKLNENIFLKANDQFEDPIDLNAGGGKANAGSSVARTTNPVIKFAQGDYPGVVSICPNDGKELPKLFLCGSNDSRLIETGITDATSIQWQRRTGGCPAVTNANCANEAFACTWTNVATGPNYNADTAGEFRVRIRYFDESVYVYYFNVYKNDLDPTGIVKSDIVRTGSCTIPGSIRAGGFGANYEYSFTTAASAGAWQPNDTFPVTVAGTYNVFIRLKGVSGSCIFSVKKIVVSSLTFSSTLTATQPKCSGDKGSIIITTNDTNRDYKYIVKKDGAAYGTFGPSSVSEYPLNGLLPGLYEVVTSIEGSACISDTESIRINSIAPVDATLGVITGTSCSAGNISVTASGGTAPYKYSYSINGGDYISNGNNTTIIVSNDGTYNIRVEDANGCSVVKTIPILATLKPEYTIKLTHQGCDGTRPSITISDIIARGYSLEYSINGGAFQTSPVFAGLQPGNYSVAVRYGTKKSNGSWNSYCEDKAGTVKLLGGNTQLTASGGVAELVGCSTEPGNENKGKVRITNPQGGVAPFKYSFDNRGSWIDKNEAYVLPSDQAYTLYIKDALGCEYEMKNIKLDFRPADPSITYSDVIYDCNGKGELTAKVTNSGGPGYAYQYTLDGVINTNTPPNVFNNIKVGSHTIRVDYKLLSVPTYSNLLLEDFGVGDPTKSPGIAAAYCWNDQRVNAPYLCTFPDGTPSRSVEDNAYAVTYFHWRSDDPNSNNSGAWFHFKDHTTNPNNLPNTGEAKGRFLLVNVGSAAGPNGILYSKPIKDVIPNQPVEVNVAVANLLKLGVDGAAPAVLFQLVDKNGNVVASHNTGEIAPGKNDPNRNKWVTPPTITLDPGDNTELTFVIRSGSILYGGNDLLIDDISVRQLPKSCVGGGEFNFDVLDQKAFKANIANANPVTCNGTNDGSFEIVAENFDPTNGFEYSLDGGTNWYISKVGTVNFPNVNFPSIGAKTYNIKVRNKGVYSCDKTISAVITAPPVLTISAQSFPGTCGKGRVEVTITGGTAPYKNVILKKKSDGTTTAFIYDVPSGKYILTDVLADTYTVIAEDNKNCPSTLGTDLVVTGPTRPRAEIDVTSNFCFTNASGASIKVNIIGGQGPYAYKVSRDGGLNYGSYSATFTATSFTYPAPTTGTYHFIILDANSCDAIATSQTINPQFEATPTVKAALSCKAGAAAAATIEVKIDGGTSPYKYLVKDSLGNTLFTSGSITNPVFQYSTTIADTYTFEITDANKCTISIKQKVSTLVQPTAKETTKDVTCVNADNGYVDLEGVTGLAPFTFQFNGVGTFDTKTHYGGLKGSVAGITYTYIVKDANECTKSYSFKIYQKDDLAGTATILPAYNCDNPATITVSGVLGGTAPYQYSLLKGGVVVAGPQDGLVFNNINAPGVYSVTITDANSCTKTIAAGTIAALNPPAAMNIKDSGAKCPDNKANVTITNVRNAAGTAITGTLEYRIVLPVATAFQPGNVFTGLDATVNYTFEVRDANKCTYQENYAIAVPKSFSVGSKSTPVKCFGASDGTVTFTVTGIATGTNYTYKIDSDALVSATSAGSPFDISKGGLSVGEHTIIVTNLATNCAVTEKVEVKGPTAKLALNLPNLTHVTCKDLGTATINAVDGWGTYTYTVTRTAPLPAGTAVVQSNNKFTNLIAGTYSVSVTDLGGCTVAGQTFTINDLVKPLATIDVTSTYCAGGAGATLIATPSAAPKPNPDYEYSLNGGTTYQNSGSFPGLAPGNYTITVRDKVTGCTNTVNAVAITIASPVTATPKIISDLTCDPTSPEAKIEVSIQNGYPDYKYRVNTTGAPFSGVYTNVGAGLTKFSVLRNQGTYYFEITDSKGCTVVVSQKVDATVKPDFTTKLVAVKCKGGATGTITVDATPTSGTYTYVLNTIPATTAVTQTTSNVFTGLKAGDYSIVVIDAKKCQSDAKTVTINEPLNPLDAIAKVSVGLTCDAANGTVAAKITVTPSGGTPYAAPDLYRYSYNGQTPVTSNVYVTTVSGNVTIEVFDANGCSFVVPSGITIDALAPPTKIDFTQIAPITCEAGHDKTSLKLDVTGGVLPLKYEITGPTAAATAVTINAYTHTFTGLVPAHYYFKVTDLNGCTKIGDFEILDVTGIQSDVSIVKNVTCNAASNGSIKYTVSGNRTGGYTYTLVGSASGTISTLPAVSGDVITYSGLKGGESYTFTVTNTVTKCFATSIISLAEPVAITAFTAKATNIYCNYSKTDITVSATAAGTTLYYAVVKTGDPIPTFPAGYQTSGNFSKDTAVDGVSYTAYVSNKDGNCVQSVGVSVATDALPTIDPITAPLCYSGTNFTVKIVGTVYSGTPLYGLNGSYDTNDTKTITGPGKYTLGVKDNHGCEKTLVIDVNNQLTITVTPTKELTCEVIPPFTTKDAQFNLSAGGGVGPYTYRVSFNGGGYTTTGITGSTFTTSAAGNYQFEATDSNTPKCTVLSSVVQVEPLVLPEIASAVQSQKILCPTESTGAIKVTLVPNKGTAPFKYEVVLLDMPFTNYGSQMTGLPAGNYAVKVTDAKGCSDTENVQIKKPSPFVVDYEIIGLKCDPAGGISKGSIIIKSVTGGTVTSPGVPGATGYSYYVTGTNYNKSELNTDGTTSVTFTIVDFGLYKIRIVDENGCSVEFPDKLVASPPNKLDITVTSPPADCDTTTPGGGGGSATVEVGSAFAGTGPFFFSIYKGSNVAYPAGVWQAEDVDGLGVRLKKTTFTNLTPGVTYTYVVYDTASKCYYYETGAPAIPSNSTLTASNVVPQNVTCADVTDGKVSFSVTSIYSGATNFTYEIFDALTHASTGVTGTGTVAGTSTATFTSPSALDLGFYYILIKEVGASPNKGCSIATTSFKIDKSARLLNITAKVDKNATCSTLGTISAEAKDGTGPFTYQAVLAGTAVDPTKWKNGNSFDLAGSVGTGISYDIYVKDVYGCTKYFTLPLPQDPSPAISLSIVDKCADEGKFKVVVTETTKGIEPYFISVNNSLFKPIGTLPYTIEDLSSGAVDVIIRDSNGCETPIVKSPITATPKVLAKLAKVLDCSGATSNATIKVDITNGTGPFTYEVYKDGTLLTGGPYVAGGTTFNYSVATSGKYIIEVIDNNGCKIKTNEIVIDPLTTIVPASNPILAKCFGGNGTIELSATGGKSPYKFNFNNLGFSDETTYSIIAGTYSFIVKDALGCEVTDNVTLGTPADLVLQTPTVDQPTCGPNNLPQPAKVVLSATGGTTTPTKPYEYSFDNSDFSTENTYYVANTSTSRTIPYAIRDANNCTKTGTVDIIKLDPPTGFDIAQTVTITCVNQRTTVNISNPKNASGLIVIPPAVITYQIVSPIAAIIDNGPNPSFPNLLPGDYVFQITDASGCTKQLPYTIKDVTKIKIDQQSLTDITCVGAGDGKATFLVSGYGTGVNSYNYVLDTNAAVTMTAGTINLIGLAPGGHTITVQDDETKCSAVLNFNIATPAIALDFTMDVTPLGCTTFGAVKISASNGWGGYTYAVTEPAPTSTVLPSNTIGEFGGLTKTGVYSVSVKDAKGCIVTKTFELFAPINPVATIDATSVYCYNGVGAGATLVVNATTPGTPAYTPVYEYSIDNGGTWNGNNTFTDLAPGDYEVTVRDQFGCKAVAPVLVKINGQFFASAKKDKEIFCAPAALVDGKIIVEAVGGYPPYSYTVTKDGILDPTVIAFPTATATSADYVVTGPGKYKFNVTDSRSCPAGTAEIEMLAPKAPVFTATPTAPSCTNLQGEMGDGQILVALAAGSVDEPYKFTILRTVPAGGSLVTQDTGLFTGLIAGTYTVNVISAKGCEAPVPVTIAAPVPVTAALLNKTDFKCTAANVAKETIVTIGGSGGAGTAGVIGDYRYSDNGTDWYTTNEFKVFDTKMPQNLTYYVKDLKGCMASVLVPITPFPTLESASATQKVAADCPNLGQETILVSIVGGATPYKFKYQAYKDGVAIGTEVTIPAGDNTFEYVAPDAGHLYHFLITDLTTECTVISGSHFVKLYKLMKVTATPSSMVSCDGLSDGTITINIENYTKTYNYKVLLGRVAVVGPGMTGTVDVATNNPFTITGLAAGLNYTVEVLQNAYPQCPVTSNSVEITQPAALDISGMVVKVVNENCNNFGATITIDPTGIKGGTKGYKFSIELSGNAPAYSTDLSRTVRTLEVAPKYDTYIVSVEDAKGCSLSVPVKVSLDPMPTITSVKVADQCATTGYRIDVVAQGLADLQYSLDGVQYQDDSYFTVGTPGDYTVWVRDKNQCVVKAAAPVTVLKPLTLEYKLSGTPKCFDATQTITLTAGGGTVTPANSYVYTKDKWVTQQPGAVFNGLAPGNYKFRVRDVMTLCEKEIEVDITIPVAIDAMEATPRKTSCKGSADGGIVVTLSDKNVNPKYTYSLSGMGVTIVDQDSPNFNGLRAGTYSVTVKSGLGCELTLSNIVVDEPELITVKTSYTEFGCSTGNITDNATITVDKVEGGSGNYLVYEFKKGTKVLQSGLDKSYTVLGDHTGGTYTVTVYDSNNCQGSNTTPIDIKSFATIDDVDLDVKVPITCLVPETLQVIATTTGTLTAPLKYTLSGSGTTVITPQINNDGLFQGLGIGSYKITVDNVATGCSLTVYHYVYDPNTFTIAVNPIQSEICFAATNGKVELTFVDNQPTPSNDAGEFDYKITGPLPDITGSSVGFGAGPVQISGLVSGLYTVTAKLRNSPGCEVTNTFQITQPAAALDINVTSTPITCKDGSADGSITATAVGGWPGEYKYELVGPTKTVAYSDVFYFENLTTGRYTVNVKDSKGCIDSAIVDLVIPTPISFTARPSTTVLSCYGDTSATITVATPTGGQGSNYRYTINHTTATGKIITSGPQESNIFTGLGAGDYTIEVNDGFSCGMTSARISIANPSKIEASLTLRSSITCLTNAQLTISAVGGTGPYTYSEDGVTYGASFNSTTSFPVTVGTHHYFVKDNLGCVVLSNDYTVDPVTPLAVELDLRNATVNCTGESTAIIVAKATGGLGNYQYSLLNGAGIEVRAAQADGIFADLNAASGPYTVHVKSGDCEKNSTVTTVTEPLTALTSSYVVEPVKCFGENNGKIIVTASGGTGVIKYAISPNLDQFVDGGTFDRLEAGTYTVIVQDVLGCNAVYIIEVKEPAVLIASEIPNTMLPEICKGDKDAAFYIQIKGGVAPYFESLDNDKGPFLPVTGNTKDYTNQTGGKHNVYIKDSNGCISQVEIRMPEPVVLDPIAETNYDCVNNAQTNMVTVTVDASNTDLTQVDYSLDSDVGPWQAANIFTNIAPGKHYIVARHTNGCKVPTTSFEIRAYDKLTLGESEGKPEMNIISVTAAGGAPAYEYSFNGEPFTSSNKYKIYKTGDYEVIVRDQNGCTATITVHAIYVDVCLDNYFTPNGDGVYDTWGPGCTNIYNNLVFSIFDRYGRVIAKYHYGQKWDGRYNGAELPSGDYWYVLKLNDEKDAREFVGHFTLYR
ncbi:hypothetical protein Flavo103_19710 [Flavobacterium collinsii]|nr:hypothetical protein Flavo103_19710 [Flavobacterium collinsii]